MEETQVSQASNTIETAAIEESHKCRDTLVAQAKSKLIKSNVDPGQYDSEYQTQVESELAKYKSQANKIFEAEKNILSAKFKADKQKIDITMPGKELEAKLIRFESTDAEKYGENNIKTTVQKELQKLMDGAEATQENLKESREEAQKSKDKKETNDIVKNQNKQIEETEERNNADDEKGEQKAPSQDLIDQASSIGNSIDKKLKNYKDMYNSMLKEYREVKYGQAIENGEKKGAQLVGEYNEKIRNTAKKIYESNKDKIVQAQIIVDKTKQTATLKLGALLGL